MVLRISKEQEHFRNRMQQSLDLIDLPEMNREFVSYIRECVEEFKRPGSSHAKRSYLNEFIRCIDYALLHQTDLDDSTEISRLQVDRIAATELLEVLK